MYERIVEHKTKKRAAAAVIGILVAVAVGYYVSPIIKQELWGDDNVQTYTGADIQNTWKSYANAALRFEFKYPIRYYLEEREVGNAERSHFVVTLTEDTEENRLVREGKSPGREGPVAITLDVFQNIENLSADAWVRGMSDSNFKLSPDSKASTVQIGPETAVAYHWSGLYEADSFVFAKNGLIYMATVTYITPEDQTRLDAAGVFATLNFDLR
ncbi:MAG: hypothetical protein A3C84_02095 [Candidatus Ryanbacteria bacterium RIFCSPHIGHO2_02_FULL_48_12]|uniref:Uncharacterized protein n=1 Tax=Candidatus Ryanbacteria bacterium RIFCSPHIGHO2_01_FULL_48_27 TaxID=1802115 RepID=A0A1G2G3R5_9BACT|nr:MAG: hypothetical protein A2756_04525 [Candidatus Ryanbacteria bacterium RIFCSPHIGHO2_01_FULL_48_27]OGZ49244.1 MAG: hypothetical protein A3C84_02095 [Candidatus Ryanbacteria bacterium RIFCSPHIGHO2_02_FULL_48_12]